MNAISLITPISVPALQGEAASADSFGGPLFEALLADAQIDDPAEDGAGSLREVDDAGADEAAVAVEAGPVPFMTTPDLPAATDLSRTEWPIPRADADEGEGWSIDPPHRPPSGAALVQPPIFGGDATEVSRTAGREADRPPLIGATGIGVVHSEVVDEVALADIAAGFGAVLHGSPGLSEAIKPPARLATDRAPLIDSDGMRTDHPSVFMGKALFAEPIVSLPDSIGPLAGQEPDREPLTDSSPIRAIPPKAIGDASRIESAGMGTDHNAAAEGEAPVTGLAPALGMTLWKASPSARGQQSAQREGDFAPTPRATGTHIAYPKGEGGAPVAATEDVLKESRSQPSDPIGLLQPGRVNPTPQGRLSKAAVVNHFVVEGLPPGRSVGVGATVANMPEPLAGGIIMRPVREAGRDAAGRVFAVPDAPMPRAQVAEALRPARQAGDDTGRQAQGQVTVVADMTVAHDEGSAPPMLDTPFTARGPEQKAGPESHDPELAGARGTDRPAGVMPPGSLTLNVSGRSADREFAAGPEAPEGRVAATHQPSVTDGQDARSHLPHADRVDAPPAPLPAGGPNQPQHSNRPLAPHHRPDSPMADVEIREGAAHVRMEAEELGRIDIKVERTEAGIAIILRAERGDSADLMRRNADLLQRELSEAGVSNARLDFGQTGGQQGRHPGRAAPTGPVSWDDQPGNDMPPTDSPRPIPGGGRSVDVRL